MPKRVEGKEAIVVGGGQTRGETIGNGRATAIMLARHSDEARFITGVSLAVDGGEGVSWGS